MLRYSPLPVLFCQLYTRPSVRPSSHPTIRPTICPLYNKLNAPTYLCLQYPLLCVHRYYSVHPSPFVSSLVSCSVWLPFWCSPSQSISCHFRHVSKPLQPIFFISVKISTKIRTQYNAVKYSTVYGQYTRYEYHTICFPPNIQYICSFSKVVILNLLSR